MPSFSLRPVDASPSPSPTASSSDHSGPQPPPAPRHTRSHSRRPLSPSSLRDVDLTQPPDAPPRRYPAPPTGHDLMALFPAQAPDSLAALRAGPTSGYFQRQERQFFAQAGREIVRVRVDVDVDPAELLAVNAAKRVRAWGPPHPPHPPAPQSQSQAQGHRPPSLPATPVFPPAPNPHPPTLPPHPPPHPHPHPHAAAPPPPSAHAAQHPNARSPPPVDDAGSDDAADDAWRRPMPYHERRRAGKHTKRVVVRN